MIFSSPIREGLSLARSQPPPPAREAREPQAGGGSFSSVLATVGTEPGAPRPGLSSPSHSDPRRPLRALRPLPLPALQQESFPRTPWSWSAPGHMDHAFLEPCSSLHHMLEVRVYKRYKRFSAPTTQPPPTNTHLPTHTFGCREVDAAV